MEPRYTLYPEGVKPRALVPVTARSIYRNYSADLPSRMAWLAPDAAAALVRLQEAMEEAGGALFLSDCYRSELDQAKAYFDYLTWAGHYQIREDLVRGYPDLRRYVACNQGRGKKAYSTPPGASFHEAGRAIDIDMDPARLGLNQKRFAEIAHGCGWRDIVHGNFGDPMRVDVKEEWHWEFLGPCQKVYDGLLAESGDPKRAYRETARRAVAAIREAE